MSDVGGSFARGADVLAEPSEWWGPIWDRPCPRTVVDLIRDGTLDVATAAVLWTLIARRRSLVVAAGPSGAGKTTLLTALLDFLPPGTERVFIRGRYEPFDRLKQCDPIKTALLVNEISPHLPIYTWDDGVRRLIEATERGFQVLATAHARSIEEFAYSLSGYPTRIQAHELAAFATVVLLDAWTTGDAVHRRVRDVVSLSRSADGRGLETDGLVERGAVHLRPLWCAAQTRTGCTPFDDIEGELARHRAGLEALAADPAIQSRATLRQAIMRWR